MPRLQRGQQIVQTGGCRDPQQPQAFAAGSPDLRAFPLALWKQLAAQRLRLQGESLLRYGDPQGYLPLREAIAAHVNQTRGVVCDARQVIVLTSSQQALQLIATLLLDRGDSVWMEEPGYTGARNAFISAGAALTPVAVDGDGLRAESSLPDPRLIYLTPHTNTRPAPRSAWRADWRCWRWQNGNRPGSSRTITTASFITTACRYRRCRAWIAVGGCCT